VSENRRKDAGRDDKIFYAAKQLKHGRRGRLVCEKKVESSRAKGTISLYMVKPKSFKEAMVVGKNVGHGLPARGKRLGGPTGEEE